MTIGIIAEPKSYTRKFFYKRLLNIHTFEKIKDAGNPFEAIVEIVPLSRKSLERMKAVRLKKLLFKKIKLLKKNGVTKYLLSDYLLHLCQSKGIDTDIFFNGSGRKLFLKLMPLCIRQIAKKSGIDLFSSMVCISDTKMDRISEYLMRELCFDTKKLYLSTQNIKSAKAFCENFCDETGLWIDICDSPNPHCDIVLDVDSCHIKFGNDLFIRDAKFDFNLCGFNICHTDIVTLLPNQNLIPTEWVCSYS